MLHYTYQNYTIATQGLADTFILLGMAFDSPEAAELNKEVFETIYHAAVSTSCELSKVEGPYSSYEGSPMSRGELQFDMWGIKPSSGRYNWDDLRDEIR